MALPDFPNCELSTEDLDAIAAGFSIGGLLHDIGSGLKSFFTSKPVAIAAGIIIGIGAIVTGGSAAHHQN